MRASIYKVKIRGMFQEYNFSCDSVQSINMHIKHFIYSNGYRLNITIRNYYTEDIIQYSSIHADLFVFNMFNSSLRLIRRKNSFYFTKT